MATDLFDALEERVGNKMQSVTDVISEAISQSSEIFDKLSDLGDLRAPFAIPPQLNYTPEKIDVGSPAPKAPGNIDEIANGLNVDSIEPFSPADVVPMDFNPGIYIDTLEKSLEPANIDKFSPTEITPLNDSEILPDILSQLMPSMPPDRSDEGDYQMAISSLISKIESMMNGEGFSPAAEAGIWDRRRERDDQAYADARDRFASSWAADGWDLPDGVLAAGMLDLATKGADARLDVSRDISVESYKAAAENTRFAVGQAVILESNFMQLFNSKWERAMRYVAIRADIGAKLFGMVIDSARAKAEIKLSDLRTKIELEKARIDDHTAQLEFEKTTAEISLQKVSMVKGFSDIKLADVQTQAEIEKARIDDHIAMLQKAKTEADINIAKLDALMRKYGIDIQGWSAGLSRDSAMAQITVEQQRIVAQNYLAQFQAGLESQRNNLQTFVQVANLRQMAATEAGRIIASYISAAMNSLNAVLHMDAGYSETKIAK